MTYGKGLRMARVLLTISLAGMMLLLAGCGGAGAGSTQTGSPVSITLVPSATVVTYGQSITVTATVYDQSNQGAVWTLSPASFGALSNQTATTVTYTAPTTISVPTTVTITATSITNPNIASSVQISASAIQVSISANFQDGTVVPLEDQTVNQGDQLLLTPNVTNDLKNQGVTWSLYPPTGAGSLQDVTAIPPFAYYAAPAAVTSPVTATVTVASVASPTSTASMKITVFPSGGGQNVSVVNVDGGPAPGYPHANGAFTSVTICNPGSLINCQTIDGILVDTGSYGLRILQSAIPLLKLPQFVDSNGNILENCALSADGSYLWGPVSRADIYVAGETAASTRVQVISSSNGTVPDTCSNIDTANPITTIPPQVLPVNENTPQLLGANGILGVGPEPTDCTVVGVNYCDGSVQATPPNLYYTCPSAGCANIDLSIIVPKTLQLLNPIPSFNADNNGVILQLPPVSLTQVNATGTMIFGIGTEPNNQLGSATIFSTDSQGYLTTTYNGQTLTSSFIDSGSDALYFPDSLPTCTTSTQFFCPTSSTMLAATNQGANQSTSIVNFSVDNADNLFSTYPGNAVFSTLAGPEGPYNTCSNGSGSCTFDWGLPFFYGRTVYAAIDGQSVPSGAPPAPWWAY